MRKPHNPIAASALRILAASLLLSILPAQADATQVGLPGREYRTTLEETPHPLASMFDEAQKAIISNHRLFILKEPEARLRDKSTTTITRQDAEKEHERIRRQAAYLATTAEEFPQHTQHISEYGSHNFQKKHALLLQKGAEELARQAKKRGYSAQQLQEFIQAEPSAAKRNAMNYFLENYEPGPPSKAQALLQRARGFFHLPSGLSPEARKLYNTNQHILHLETEFEQEKFWEPVVKQPRGKSRVQEHRETQADIFKRDAAGASADSFRAENQDLISKYYGIIKKRGERNGLAQEEWERLVRKQGPSRLGEAMNYFYASYARIQARQRGATSLTPDPIKGSANRSGER